MSSSSDCELIPLSTYSQSAAVPVVEEDVLCIFYSIFHHEAGPKIECQSPDNFITKDKFDKISRFIITKTELTNRLVWLDAFGYRIMGCAQCIESKHYKRNAFHFNFGLVISMACLQPGKYEMITRKLGRCFHNMEVERGYLNNGSLSNKLADLLHILRDKLNHHINIDTALLDLHLKPIPPPLLENRCSLPHDFDVPVLLNMPNPSQTDIVTALILPFINGAAHVANIAVMADVDIAIVKLCLQNLCQFNAVKFLPLTLYSDSFACLHDVRRLLHEQDLIKQCQSIVTIEHAMPPPSSQQLFRLLSCMNPGRSLRDIVHLHPGLSTNVDVLRLAQFCLLHKLVRRVNTYPVRLQSVHQQGGDPFDSVTTTTTTTSQQQVRGSLPVHLLDGYHSVDELCAQTGTSREKLMDKLECDSLVVLLKR